MVHLPNYRLLLVFTGGRRFRKLFGRGWATIFYQAKHPAVDPLRRTIGPVTHVTNKLVASMREGNHMCFVLHVFRLVKTYNT